MQHDVPHADAPAVRRHALPVRRHALPYSLMEEVPAITLAAWRLQLTSVLLGLGAAVQWRGMVG